MTEQDKQALIKHFCERDCGEAAKDCTIMPCHEIELVQEFPTTEADSDTISRQSAIDALNHERCCGAVIDHCGLETAMDIISGLPPTQTERITSRWIPCGERTPENDNDVLVQMNDGSMMVDYRAASSNGWFWAEFGDEPVAWMPLPEPYKKVTT